MILIDWGANLNAVNKKGETPLALGSAETLVKLGFQNGIVQVNAGAEVKFDNHKMLLAIKKDDEFERDIGRINYDFNQSFY